MSKCLKEVFAKMFHVSFLETIGNDPCTEFGSMDIIVEEQHADGSPWTKEATRHVSVCQTRDECSHYEIKINPETGIGKITIDNIQAAQYVAVQVDEHGQQMMNHDAYDITYYVNGEASEEDRAVLYFTSDEASAHQTLRIVDKEREQASLEVTKILRDAFGHPQSLDEDSKFSMCLRDDHGFEQFFVLHYGNGFRCVLENLRPGCYTISEYECEEYTPLYRLNGGEEAYVGHIELLPGANELQVINEKRRKTQLTIEKYIRSASGELCKPGHGEEFHIRVISNSYDQVLYLDDSNDYCVTLVGLEPGYYDISEVDNDMMEGDVTYIVNGKGEECYAALEINECESANVMVINHARSGSMIQDSQLRICKYLRRCDGSVTKPEPDMQFMVMVNGCGMCETFYLNSNNNFCVDLANLCSGEYDIREISCGDYTTSYIVNDGMERTSAKVMIQDCEAYCVSIINEQRNRGTLSVTKYIRNEYGDLIKPQKHQCFTVTLSSYFCKKTVVLNAENDWSICFQDLRFGSYEIREEENNEYQVSYQLNCEEEKRHARILIDDSCENEIRIINSLRRTPCGILKISKFEETATHELVKPSRDEEFEVAVQGPCFDECYVLRASNNWCIMLEGLLSGEYDIRELNGKEYDVSYQVNREPCEEAHVYMGAENQEVCVINHRKTSGKLKLCATIRDCNGELRRPPRTTRFEMLVESSDDSFTVCLRAENNWCVLLDQLCEGVYRIIQKDNLGYKVSYDIDGKETSFARITLGREDVEVCAINEESCCTGMVKVTKYLEDEHGNLYMPCPSDEFRFELSGHGFCRTYKLRARNDFCVYFDDLMEGSYEVKELDEDYVTRYRVNGEYVEHAVFDLEQEDIYVDIINRPKERGIVSVEKRIRRGTRLTRPDDHEVYQILLKGKNCHEVYELHAENDFCVCFKDLKNQHYEIREIGNYCKMYEVNGTLQEDGYFLYEGENVEITVINEEIPLGCMEIEKRIEDEQGVLRTPARYESFEVIVESDAFKQKVLLHHENDFRVQLFDLPQGHYEVYETACEGKVSYLINGLPCASACVDVGEQDVCITVINSVCAKGSIQFHGMIEESGCLREPHPDEVFKLVISSEEGPKECVLNQDNDFCTQLCDLPCGAYTITECQKEDVRFEIDGQVFDDVVCIELNGEDVCVQVVRTITHRGNITIKKMMMDNDGCITYPDKEASYEITLQHNGRKQMFELNCDNDWTKVMKQQEAGEYKIIEVEGGSDVRYQVNGGDLSRLGCFTLGEEDVHVAVLNRVKEEGVLHLEAAVKDCEGEVITPYGDMIFYMLVHGAKTHKRIRLDQHNHWHHSLLLEAGNYTIEQESEPGFDGVYYLVDDCKEHTAVIRMKNSDRHIQSINILKCNGGCIDISKYCRDNNCGCLKRPDTEDEYEVEIRGEQYHKIITLNSCNHWREHLDGLANGLYRIKELAGKTSPSYSINGGEEVKDAFITLQDDTVDVKVINEERSDRGGSIELCKLIRDGEGCYRYPDETDSYWVTIKGENHTSRVLLNYANHFYASIRNLTQGWYEVIEESQDEGITYVVNNAAATKRGLVHVMQNANTVNIINPLHDSNSVISLDKYVQSSEGLLMRPTTGEYRIRIRKEGYQEVVLLNQKNQYHENLTQLPQGSYDIEELDHGQVLYRIDGGEAMPHGKLLVDGDSHQVQIINRAAIQKKGSMTLAKYIRVNGQLMRPSKDESYVFHVSKPGFHELYTLDESNRFMMTISNLEDGDYTIRETAARDDVSFIINGGEESSEGVVSVYGSSNTVQIINTHPNTGSILLHKYIRMRGTLQKPQEDFTTRIRVAKPGYEEIFTLNKENNWTYTVQHLANGLYEVEELDHREQVMYSVDHGSEVLHAVVQVTKEQHDVAIINGVKEECGSITLRKYRRKDDQMLSPDHNFVTRIHVSKPGYNEIFTLSKENNWTATATSLASGLYVVDELDNGDRVTYIVDGGSETAGAIVQVEDNPHTVDIINTETTLFGSIRIEKYMRDESNRFVQPDPGFVAKVHVSKQGYNEVFTLNEANNWKITLKDLLDGYYVINEVDANDEVTYIVNGQSEVSSGIVQVTHNENVVQMINTPRVHKASLTIKKFLRNAGGQLVQPGSDMSFQVLVNADRYSSSITLNRFNNWTVTLNDLENGYYQIVENSSSAYQVTYIIDRGTERTDANVLLNDDAHTVNIINSTKATFGKVEISKYIRQSNGSLMRPVAGDVFDVEVYNEEYRREVRLDSGNSFTAILDDLASGVYTVREMNEDRYATTYRINGGTATDSASVIVNDANSNIVEIINELRVNLNTIEVFKYMLDEDDNYLPPSPGDVYTFTITGNNITQSYELNEGNNWHQTLTGLASGEYRVEETSDNHRVKYLINSPQLRDEAVFTAVPGSTNIIGIINVLGKVEQGKLKITKRMSGASGSLDMPTSQLSFVVEVRSDDFHQYVVLDQNNGYESVLEHLPYGSYQVKEMASGYRVSYRVNQMPISTQARLEIDNDTLQTVMVINTPDSVNVQVVGDHSVKVTLD